MMFKKNLWIIVPAASQLKPLIMKKIFICTLVLMFSSAAMHAQEVKKEPPPPPVPAEKPEKPAPGLKKINKEEFLKKYPEVKSVEKENPGEVIIYLKNGKSEKYDLSDEKQKKAFEKKYLKRMPAPPPPPEEPPPPPEPKPEKEGN